MLYILILKKVFDTVPHQRLFHKLQAYGISGNVLDWIKDFLCNRKQRVVINGGMSTFQDVRSGVPQGSVLGPLLFVLFINDLPNSISSHCKLFDNETKLYGSSENHCEIIENDIIKLS